MKAIWGTDESVRSQQSKDSATRMIANAEVSVDRLNRVLDERPARNLDEALYQVSRRDRE